MADIHILGTNIINGYATIKPTDGFPSGQIIHYASAGRTLDNTAWTGPDIDDEFNYVKIVDVNNL